MTATTGSNVRPVLIDSSGWLEYLTAGPKADLYAEHFMAGGLLIVPTIVIYEVTKILLRKHSKTVADVFLSQAFDTPQSLSTVISRWLPPPRVFDINWQWLTQSSTRQHSPWVRRCWSLITTSQIYLAYCCFDGWRLDRIFPRR